MKVFLCLALALVLAGCGSHKSAPKNAVKDPAGNTYTASFEKKFIQACPKTAAQSFSMGTTQAVSYCKKLLTCVEKNITYQDLVARQQAVSNKKVTDPATDKKLQTCVSKSM